jgi:hypothetical protein
MSGCLHTVEQLREVVSNPLTDVLAGRCTLGEAETIIRGVGVVDLLELEESLARREFKARNEQA